MHGHTRIALVATSLLKGKRRDQVRSMLKGDLIDFADWEQKMSKEFPETAQLHWHHQNPEWTCDKGIGHKGKVHCDGTQVAWNSILCASVATFEKYSHDALLKEFPETKDPVLKHSGDEKFWENVTQYLKQHNMDKPWTTKDQELRWLASLIGDMHQPLHWLAQRGYGKDLTVVYQGKDYTLLDFWENFLPRKLPRIPDQKVLDQEFHVRAEEWSHRHPSELLRDWAMQQAESVCNDVYRLMEVNHADGTRDIAARYEVSEEQFQQWLKLAQDATLLAGQRLAFVLQDLIEHRKHKLAHKEGRGRHHRRRSWAAHAGTNAMIAAVLVPSLLLFLNWHQRMGGPSFFRLAKEHLKI